MKALEILKEQLKILNNDVDGVWIDPKRLEEAIAELEALDNRSCMNCICWDSVDNSKLKTISYCRFLNTGTKNIFYCNEYEPKC